MKTLRELAEKALDDARYGMCACKKNERARYSERVSKLEAALSADDAERAAREAEIAGLRAERDAAVAERDRLLEDIDWATRDERSIFRDTTRSDVTPTEYGILQEIGTGFSRVTKVIGYGATFLEAVDEAKKAVSK